MIKVYSFQENWGLADIVDSLLKFVKWSWEMINKPISEESTLLSKRNATSEKLKADRFLDTQTNTLD